MKFLHASQRCTLCLFLTLPLLAIGFALYIADVWLFDRAHVSLFYPPSHHSPAPLEVLCASKTWSEGLYLICDHNRGGVGNVVAQVLACVRYAIDAGAGLTTPLIERRSSDLSKLTNGDFDSLSYMFDEAWFLARLNRDCPQMRIYSDSASVPNLHAARFAETLKPLELHNGFVLNEYAKQFPQDLQEHIKHVPSFLEPIFVPLDVGPFEWPVYEDPKEFRASFGKILQFRNDTQVLAEKILGRLHGIQYLGAHLRTDADVKDWNLPYDVQRDSFFNQSLAHGLDTIYVASGNPIDTERLREEALFSGVKVMTKGDLLDSEDRQQLENLTWDQQALVDYLVLRDSTFFLGTSLSSFSVALAYARHLDLNNTDFPFPMDEKSRLEGGNIAFFEQGMWPI